jgi:GNAT superfamily N-acetyltransferase
MTSISVRPATIADLSEVADLIQAQERRQYANSAARLAVRSRQQIDAMLASLHKEDVQPLVALNEDGKIRAYACPSVWSLNEGSILLSFLTARNGIVRRLTLPHPADEDANAVTAALLSILDDFWRSADTSGDLIRWPGGDAWIEPPLMRYGFQLDSICAVRSLAPFFSTRPAPLPLLCIRPAQPEDEYALIDLFEEELRFHERYTPFVHSSSQVLQAFRRKLQRLWQGGSLADGAPMVLVVEQTGVIVAMTENTLLEVGSFDEPGFTPEGRYWCIDNISVREAFQGQGIGRHLLQAIEDQLTALQLDLDGYILWFNPDNPKAATFWTRLGFQPLWTTYQRLVL